MVIGIKELRNFTDQQWLDLLQDGWTVSGVLRLLGAKDADTRLRTFVIDIANRLGISRSPSRGQKHQYNIQQVKDAIANSICWSDVLKNLGLSAHGNNHLTLKKLVVENNIDCTHFDLKAAYRRNKGVELRVEDVFVSNSNHHRSTVRRLVLKHKLLDYCCVKCNNVGKWIDEVLNLQLDHIDGDSTNHEIGNLRFLCPNCHSQTPTFGRRNH